MALYLSYKGTICLWLDFSLYTLETEGSCVYQEKIKSLVGYFTIYHFKSLHLVRAIHVDTTFRHTTSFSFIRLAPSSHCAIFCILSTDWNVRTRPIRNCNSAVAFTFRTFSTDPNAFSVSIARHLGFHPQTQTPCHLNFYALKISYPQTRKLEREPYEISCNSVAAFILMVTFWLNHGLKRFYHWKGPTFKIG